MTPELLTNHSGTIPGPVPKFSALIGKGNGRGMEGEWKKALKLLIEIGDYQLPRLGTGPSCQRISESRQHA